MNGATTLPTSSVIASGATAEDNVPTLTPEYYAELTNAVFPAGRRARYAHCIQHGSNEPSTIEGFNEAIHVRECFRGNR
jgi:hypothetical protein